MSEHARLAPSKAYRWLNCTGSLLYRDGADPGPEALEGLKKHEDAANCLKTGKNSEFEDVQLYLDFVRSLIGQRYVERRVSLKSISDEIFGTADAIVINPFIKMTIVDFKSGKHEVEAIRNPQLTLYAIAAWDSLQLCVSDIDLAIVQPNAPSGDQIKVWRLDTYELGIFRDRILAAYKEDKEGNHQHIPGDWCQWCPGASECPAIISALPELDNPVSETDVDKIVRFLDAETGIKRAYDQLKIMARSLLLQGIEVPGYKLVRGLGNRVWIDEEKVHKKVGKKKSTKTVTLSPAQFEKKHPEHKAWVTNNTVRPDKGLILVTEKDKRRAVALLDALPKLLEE